MKQISKFFVLAIVMIAFTVSTYGQASATATATATILAPITLTKTADLNFGNIFSSVAGGTVTVAPDGTRTFSGVTLPVTPGTVTAAAFTVTGTGTATYSITLPAAATTITNAATNTMSVAAWTSTPSGTGTLTGGTQTLTVGATLTVGPNQPSGIYTSGTPFTVTVNYN